jgi:hypothetical protein
MNFELVSSQLFDFYFFIRARILKRTGEAENEKGFLYFFSIASSIAGPI